MLGHVLLCGVLFVTYQARAGIKGQYMLCALFKSSLVIATARKNLTLFDVVASIPLLNTSIQDADNGKGRALGMSIRFVLTARRPAMSYCALHLEACVPKQLPSV